MSISSLLAMHIEIPHGIPPSPLDVASITRIKHNALYSFVGKESPRQVSNSASSLSKDISHERSNFLTEDTVLILNFAKNYQVGRKNKAVVWLESEAKKRADVMGGWYGEKSCQQSFLFASSEISPLSLSGAR